MRILYIGDVMGEPGVTLIEQIVPAFRKEKNIDTVIAQAENVTNGKGIIPEDFDRLLAAGVDFCTGGNWTMARDEITELLNDPDAPIIRPANYPDGSVGKRYKYLQTPQGKILVVSLLGRIVGRDADVPVDNPLKVIDKILADERENEHIATIVNFHGDYSSEKVVIGHYLDGRVSLVVGDHWHVPTADEAILPKGTAHITDVGMSGSLDSSLGVTFESVIPRWRDGIQSRNVLEEEGRQQFNAVLITTDDQTGKALSIERIRQII